MTEKNSQNYYLKLEEPLQSCLLAVRDIILSADGELSECIKYGVPCFVLNGKPVCYLFKKKNAKLPYILFVKGKELDFPELESGDRKLMKSLSIDPEKDIDIELVLKVLNAAIELQK